MIRLSALAGAACYGALAAFCTLLLSLPAQAEVLDPASLDLVATLVVPYVAHGLSVSSVLGVIRWFVPALKATPGQRLPPEKVRLVRTLCLGLALLSTFTGKVPPLGGAEAGVIGQIGAGALVALLAMAMRDALHEVTRRKPAKD
jgi:hypothetical protein